MASSSSSLRSSQPLPSIAVRQHQQRQTTSSSVRSRPSATSRRSLTPTSRLPASSSDDAAGRVRVAVRVRPRNHDDRASDSDYGDSVEVQPELKRLKLRKNNWMSESYRFDEIFTEAASQNRVYQVVAKPVVESVLNGYNGTVMAYGQTGTGKTYTLGRMGCDDASERGIMVRALEDIISSTAPESDTVEVSYLQIIFRDFKSSNILLDEHWNAKLSDFGLARLGPSDGVSHVSTAVVGTVGYAAPEYIQTGHLTSKSDVWSYGIFLYELITGRRPVDRNRPKNEQKLLEWVRAHMSADSKKFQLIMDPRLEGKYSLKAAQKLAAVANRCLVRQPRSRPKMSEALEMINRIVETTTDMGSPQELPSESVDYSKNEYLRGSKREILRRKLVDPLVGENGCLNLQIWRPKIVKAS